MHAKKYLLAGTFFLKLYIRMTRDSSDGAPLSHSYKFIEKSVSNGVLESLDEHRVGPSAGQIRAIGSVIQPAKGTRQKYTADDDRILWDWVHKNPQKLGGTRGNEIYKQLEQKVNEHSHPEPFGFCDSKLAASTSSMAVMARSLGQVP